MLCFFLGRLTVYEELVADLGRSIYCAPCFFLGPHDHCFRIQFGVQVVLFASLKPCFLGSQQAVPFGVWIFLSAMFFSRCQLGFFCPLHTAYVEYIADFGFLAFFWLSGLLLAFWPSSGFLAFFWLSGLLLTIWLSFGA